MIQQWKVRLNVNFQFKHVVFQRATEQWLIYDCQDKSVFPVINENVVK